MCASTRPRRCADAGVDYPGGFLYEWWVVFWEIFNTRSKQSYSEAASQYLEVSCSCERGTPAVAVSMQGCFALSTLLLPWRMQVQRAKHQQQVLQLQLHQTIQQRKVSGWHSGAWPCLAYTCAACIAVWTGLRPQVARLREQCGDYSAPGRTYDAQAKQVEALRQPSAGLGGGLPSDALVKLDGGQPHVLSNGISLGQGDRSGSLQGTSLAGGANRGRMMAALAGMGPGPGTSPTLQGQVRAQSSEVISARAQAWVVWLPPACHCKLQPVNCVPMVLWCGSLHGANRHSTAGLAAS